LHGDPNDELDTDDLKLEPSNVVGTRLDKDGTLIKTYNTAAEDAINKLNDAIRGKLKDISVMKLLDKNGNPLTGTDNVDFSKIDLMSLFKNEINDFQQTMAEANEKYTRGPSHKSPVQRRKSIRKTILRSSPAGSDTGTENRGMTYSI